MKCPRCNSRNRVVKTRHKPSWLWRPWGKYVKCDACLHVYFRVRLLGLLIHVAAPARLGP